MRVVQSRAVRTTLRRFTCVVVKDSLKLSLFTQRLHYSGINGYKVSTVGTTASGTTDARKWHRVMQLEQNSWNAFLRAQGVTLRYCVLKRWTHPASRVPPADTHVRAYRPGIAG